MTRAPVTLRLFVGRLDERTGSPIVHRINDIDVDPAVVTDIDVFVRWAWRQIAQHEQHAKLLARALDLIEETDYAASGAITWAADEIRREAGLNVNAQLPDARLGWPWCGDVPTSREIRGEVTATRHDDDTITLTWDQPDATCTIISRDVLDGIAEERNRLTTENREYEQRAAEVVRLLAGHCDDCAVLRTNLTIQDGQLNALRAELDSWRKAHRERGDENERLTAENERLRIVETASIGAHALLDDAEETIERLRAELAECHDRYGRLFDRAEATVWPPSTSAAAPDEKAGLT